MAIQRLFVLVCLVALQYVQNPQNEWSVKVAKAQKRSDVLNFGGHRPVFDTRNFDRVHAHYPLFKDYPQVIHMWGMESALLWFEI
jgi:hypothetical protein